MVQSGNFAGYISMWLESLKKVFAKFPNLTEPEKAAMRQTIDSGTRNLSTRLHWDMQQFAGVLATASRLLGKPC